MTDETIPKIDFDEVPMADFLAARDEAAAAIKERAPLTAEEIADGWSEDPVSGLRVNSVTGEYDDRHFVHIAPRRPSGTRA
jgi:hypothetical protein